jgi:chromosome segregation ATPase
MSADIPTLNRTIAQLEKGYCDARMDARVLEGRVDALVAENAQLESLLQAVERDLEATDRDLDTAKIDLAAVTADRDMIAAQRDAANAAADAISGYRIDESRESNALYAENRRLRDVIVSMAGELFP